MARTKGMLNLSGNLEVNAQAPLDARTIVPTEADLTVASNFPYPYIGLEVYVTSTGKKFRLINLDTTQSSSWHEVTEGGGTGGGHTIQDDGTDMTARDNLNFVGFNVTDDSTNNRTTVAFPNVDFSMLGIDAFQFSTDEKPIGMWTDRKIVYQKVFTNKTMPSANGLIANTVVADLEKAIKTTIIATGGNQIIINPSLGQNIIAYYKGTSGVWVDYTNNPSWVYGSTVEVIIQYTKTTDSPLSADEKFAGVTSGGEVIYEQNVTINNFSCSQGAETQIADLSSASIDKMIYCFGTISESSWGTASIPELGIRLRYKDGKLYLKSDGSCSSSTVTVTVRYTKTP